MSAEATPEDVLAGRARWSLTAGDCLELMPGLPDRGVDHVISDAPYESEAHTLQRRIKVNRGGDAVRGGNDLRGVRVAAVGFPAIEAEERAAAGAEFGRLARRWILEFCQVEAVGLWAGSIAPARYIRTALWLKPDGQPQLSGDRPGMGYEAIMVAHAPGACGWNGGGRCGKFEHCTARNDGPNDHPTPKPISLMVELVELFTDPDEVVLDPFSGSGTTGVACLRLGRRFIGFEKDPKYAQIARDRLTAESRGQTLRQFRAGQISMFPPPGGGARE